MEAICYALHPQEEAAERIKVLFAYFFFQEKVGPRPE
jgi:hypothetical protein